MGSLFCKQRRGHTPARAQRTKKLQQPRRGDCLLRAPCMLCFLVREPAVSEPVPPAPRALDCAHLLLPNSRPERSSTVQETETDMVCKRKNSGDSQQPGTPCKQPRCAPAGEQPRPIGQGHHGTQESTPLCAGEQGHHSTQEHTPLCAGEQGHDSTQEHTPLCAGEQGHHSTQESTPLCAGDQGHHSTQHHQENAPTHAGDQGHLSIQHHQENTPSCPGDQGHHIPSCAGGPPDPAVSCAEELALLPLGVPALEYPEKDGMPPLDANCGAEPSSQTRCTSPHLGIFSQDQQPQTLRDADPDSPRVEDEPLNINQLPPSLLLKIFSHLSLNERCLCVSLVCKYWQDLCLDFQFWKQLDLSSRCQIKDDILERIASRFWNILELNISDCLNVTDVGIGMVAGKCSGLVKYTAYRCKQLSDSSLISLATHCTSLQKVHVGNQDRLTDEAIRQLGSRCKDLRDIHFGQCYKISDDGMIIIAKGCPKLKKIYMQENKLRSEQSIFSIGFGSIFFVYWEYTASSRPSSVHSAGHRRNVPGVRPAPEQGCPDRIENPISF